MLKLTTVALLSLTALNALSQEISVKVISRIKQPLFDLGIGSAVEMQYSSGKNVKEALFLGKLVDQENETIEYLFLDVELLFIVIFD